MLPEIMDHLKTMRNTLQGDYEINKDALLYEIDMIEDALNSLEDVTYVVDTLKTSINRKIDTFETDLSWIKDVPQETEENQEMTDYVRLFHVNLALEHCYGISYSSGIVEMMIEPFQKLTGEVNKLKDIRKRAKAIMKYLRAYQLKLYKRLGSIPDEPVN